VEAEWAIELTLLGDGNGPTAVRVAKLEPRGPGVASDFSQIAGLQLEDGL
jgi:hypothetical protein